MATATLRIVVDPATKKRTIVVSYTSDSDALPMEHEDEHRAIVEKLFEGGIAQHGDTVVVERESGERAPEELAAVAEDTDGGVKQGA